MAHKPNYNQHTNMFNCSIKITVFVCHENESDVAIRRTEISLLKIIQEDLWNNLS